MPNELLWAGAVVLAMVASIATLQELLTQTRAELDFHMGQRTRRRIAVTEIEITPKMIEAGALALSKYHPDYESREEAVIRIYREMTSAHSRRSP